MMAGIDNSLLIVLDDNVASILRQHFLHLTLAEFFMVLTLVGGSVLYAIVYVWLFRRRRRTGSLIAVRPS